MQSIPMLNEFLNDERREVRGTWDNSEPKRQNLKRRTRGSTSIPLLVGFYFICRQFTPEDPAPALPLLLLRLASGARTSYTYADVSTRTKTLRDPSLSLFVRYRALFTLRNIGTPAAIDALSSALLSRMKSALPSLNMRSLLPLARYQTPIPSRGCSRSLKVREAKKWCATKRWRLLVELPRTRSCPCCESGPPRTTHPGWSGKAVWRLTCGRYVILLTSNWAYLHTRIRISSRMPMALIGSAWYKPRHSSWSSVISSLSQNLTRYVVPSTSLSKSESHGIIRQSAKLTAVEDRGTHDRLSCLR